MYKRFFFSKKTAYAAIIGIIVLCIGECLTGIMAGGMSRFDYFSIMIRLLLSVFLFDGYRKHNMQAMQGGCCGLLVCMLYSQTDYVLNDLINSSVDSFIDMGFWGSLYLAGELMLLVFEVILVVNHHVLFILKKRNLLRVSANQVTIIIMLLFFMFQLFVVKQITEGWKDNAYYGIANTGLIAAYILIACAETILSIDDRESGS